MDRDPELSWSVLCERLGMNRYDGKVGGETSRLKRQLGIMEENDGKRMSNGTKRPKRVRERIHHDHAVKIIRELGIDPLDAGL
jgi:hypothetical protein